MEDDLPPVNKDGILASKLTSDGDMLPAILPYREGRKYQLGDKYYNWSEYDFVFLPTNQFKLGWTPTLVISCERDHYWVEPDEGAVVFKNGEKCDEDVKTRLDFSDELTFAKHCFDLSGGIVSFAFEIFSQILSHLPFKSLKNARLVCRDWDEQVAPIMRAKSVIIFDPSYYEVNPSMNFLRYVHEMQNPADWPNWKIRYPTLPALGVDQNHQGAKYIIDLNWFLKPSRGHHVTSLTLSGGIYSNYEYWLKLKPVIQFSDTLEELNLKFSFIFFDMDSIERKFSGWGPISLPKLKRFTLNLAPCHDARPLSFENLSTVWMKNWADAIKGVGYVATFRRASLGSRLVQEMRRNISSGAYQNLREIVLTCKPEDGVNFLTEFNQPLKKVTLTIPLEIRHLREFENSIRKFANSLELLSLRVSTDDLEAEVRFVLNLPCFPNLKTLDFHFGEFENVGWYQGGNDGRSRVGHVARIRLAFPPVRRGDDLGVKYDLHLPSIRSIIIKPLFDDHDDDADNFWNTYADLMDSLLPKEGEGQSCKTLWNLEFPSLDDLEVETRYRQAHRLPEIFPHVRNEWMNRLREMRNN